MCRYAMCGPYKQHYACFSCRKAFKLRNLFSTDWWRTNRADAPVSCPECRQPMGDMGLDFKAPRQAAVKHWAVVEVLYHRGVRYDSCGCSGPGYRPKRWREISAFLRANIRRAAGADLAERFARRRGASRRRDRIGRMVWYTSLP